MGRSRSFVPWLWPRNKPESGSWVGGRAAEWAITATVSVLAARAAGKIANTAARRIETDTFTVDPLSAASWHRALERH